MRTNNVVYVNFKTGQINTDAVSVPETTPLTHVGPIASRKLKERTYPDGFDVEVWDKLSARYGENQPRQGVEFEHYSIVTLKGISYVDTYGYGCVHNVAGNSKRAGGGFWKNQAAKGTSYWNRPMPMPADPIKLINRLKEEKRKQVVLGYVSDAFMWMDQKYKITQAFLRHLDGVETLTIDTRSDLVAHDNYVDLLINLKNRGVTVKVNILIPGPYHDNEHMTQLLEPGTPSLKRRRLAYTKLKGCGIAVELIKENVKYTKREINLSGAFEPVKLRK
jgi:hypothetical protein